jgi:hypothetical protein
MARTKINRGRKSTTTQNVISTVATAAEAIAVGVARLAERTIVETVRAAQDLGSEIGATLARAANVSAARQHADTRAGLPARKPLAKSRAQRRRRRSAA